MPSAEDDINALLQHLWWEHVDTYATDSEYWAMITAVGKHHALADYMAPRDGAWATAFSPFERLREGALNFGWGDGF